MCVVSMIMDHYGDKWGRTSPQPTYYPFAPIHQPIPQISKEEIEEFRKLLERARAYDAKNHEPDCELQEKKERVLKIARELGVEISFL